MRQQQQQQQQQRLPSWRQQQGAPSPAPYDKTLRPEGFQQLQQVLPGNNSKTSIKNQQGILQQAHSPPLHDMTASTPPKATARSPRDEQNNNPSQAYGAAEPIIAPPQQQQLPTEPYGRPQNLTRSPPPQTPTSILNVSMTDAQIPPSSSSTQPPAQMPAPLRVQPQKPAFPAPLTTESLVSTLMQGRPIPRLDARDPEHGSALMEGQYYPL
ncbi:hypothetical protein BDR22DRAFT_717600 [Usnea florida]